MKFLLTCGFCDDPIFPRKVELIDAEDVEDLHRFFTLNYFSGVPLKIYGFGACAPWVGTLMTGPGYDGHTFIKAGFKLDNDDGYNRALLDFLDPAGDAPCFYDEQQQRVNKDVETALNPGFKTGFYLKLIV